MHSWAFEHSDPIKGSPGSHSQSVSCSVGITNSLSRTHNCARLLTVAIPVLKAAVKLAKVK